MSRDQSLLDLALQDNLVQSAVKNLGFFHALKWDVSISLGMIQHGTDFSEFEISDDGISQYLAEKIKPWILDSLKNAGFPSGKLWISSRAQKGGFIKVRPGGQVTNHGPVWCYWWSICKHMSPQKQLRVYNIAMISKAYVSIMQRIFEVYNMPSGPSEIQVSSLMMEASFLHMAIACFAVESDNSISQIFAAKELKKTRVGEIRPKANAAIAAIAVENQKELERLVLDAILAGEAVTASDWFATQFHKQWANNHKPLSVLRIKREIPKMLRKIGHKKQ